MKHTPVGGRAQMKGGQTEEGKGEPGLSGQMQLVRAGAYYQNPIPAEPLALKD